MTGAEWVPESKRLAAAYGRTLDAETTQVYFDAVRVYPSPAVRGAVTAILRESTTFPRPADLVAAARLHMRRHAVPAAACDRCAGERFTVHQCDEAAVNAATACPACGQPHPRMRNGFLFARPCPQCHPAALAQKGSR